MIGTLVTTLFIMLDYPSIVAQVQETAPAVTLARHRLAETQALQTGAAAAAPSNPDLTLTAGPGFVDHASPPALEFMAVLSWPVDFSGAPQRRVSWAQARACEAEAELAETIAQAVGEALNLFVRAHGARGRLKLAETLVAVDDDMVRVAQVRRRAGDVGDGDVALAQVLRAETTARLLYAQGELKALLIRLGHLLQIPSPAPADLTAPAWPPQADLAELIKNTPKRADIRRAQLAHQVAEADASLQSRLGWPVPRLMLGAGRGPEYQGELGVTLPLPIYQRNQTHAAVATAHTGTTAYDVARLQAQASIDVQATYAVWQSAEAALVALQNAAAAMDDAEHLALRAYELGQDNLSRVAVVRREAVNARTALIDAQVAVGRARLDLAWAAGSLP